MVSEDQKWSPRNQKNTSIEGNAQNVDTLLSPRFKSAAAMAGWDEEALLLASLIVEDTPDRDFKHKRRSVLNSKTPPTNSRRKRRAQRSPQSIPVAVLDLDEEETPRKERSGKKKKEKKTCGNEASKLEGNELNDEKSSVPSFSSALPCIDKLREELSCAICLEICFEPSTTPCGHSFCRKCLRSAADKCGKKCPKCRQLISNGRSCTVNTVLWNTIQLLFPQDVESRKAAGAINIREAAAASAQSASPETAFYNNLRNGSTTQASTRFVSTRRSSSTRDEDAALARRLQREIGGGNSRSRTPLSSSSSSGLGTRVRSSRRGVVSNSQDEDAAFALRLQREEFMQAFRGGTQEQSTRPTSITSARENLRALASRAMDLRVRDRRV